MKKRETTSFCGAFFIFSFVGLLDPDLSKAWFGDNCKAMK
jgi:hypothetical protein